VTKRYAERFHLDTNPDALKKLKEKLANTMNGMKQKAIAIQDLLVMTRKGIAGFDHISNMVNLTPQEWETALASPDGKKRFGSIRNHAVPEYGKVLEIHGIQDGTLAAIPTDTATGMYSVPVGGGGGGAPEILLFMCVCVCVCVCAGDYVCALTKNNKARPKPTFVSKPHRPAQIPVAEDHDSGDEDDEDPVEDQDATAENDDAATERGHELLGLGLGLGLAQPTPFSAPLTGSQARKSSEQSDDNGDFDVARLLSTAATPDFAKTTGIQQGVAPSTSTAAVKHHKHYNPKPSSMSKDSAHSEAVAVASSPFLKDAIEPSAPSSSSSASSSHNKKRGADNAPEKGAQVRQSKMSKEGIMVEGQLTKMNANMEGYIQACSQRTALEMQRLQQPHRREMSAAQEVLEDVEHRYADLIPAATLLKLKRKMRADLGEIDCYLASSAEGRQLIIEEHWQEIDPVGYASTHPASM
jgi:hypothetical protein